MTHWFVEEASLGLAGNPAVGLPGYAVISFNKDGTGRQVVFRAGPGSLAEARAYVATTTDGSVKDYYIIEAPGDTFMPLPGGWEGPYTIADGPYKGGTLTHDATNRWHVSGGRSVLTAVGGSPLLFLGGAAVLGAIALYAASRRKR